MADETKPAAEGVDPGLAAVIEDVLDARDARVREDVKSTLAELAEPRRERFEPVLPDTTRDARPSGVRVVPHTARQRLYEGLYRQSPSMRTCRTEELDFWNHRFLVGLMQDNNAVIRESYDKANSAFARMYGAKIWDDEQRHDAEDPKGWEGPVKHARATILEGAIDASDPTAILDGTGGHTLPQPFSQLIMIARERTAVIESLATVLPMTSATLRVPTWGAMTAEKLGEGGTPTQGEATQASKMLKAEKNQVYAKASREYIADAAFPVISMMGERAGMALGANQDVDFLTTNETAPNASEQLDGTDDTADLAAATALDFVDLSTIYRNVSQADRRGPGLAWLANTDVLTFLDTMVDGNGRPILNNAINPPQPVGDSPGNEGFVYRAPVFECPCTAGELIFGNIRQGYIVGRREGITARFSAEQEFSTGLVGFLFVERYDAVEVETASIRRYTGLVSVS